MKNEDKILEKAKPYFYEADSDKVAILIHGFTGSAYDMRELAKYLFDRGISVKVPLLAGHGRHWTCLEDSSYYDWWKTIEEEVKEISKRYNEVYLIGYSFGGNLALDIGARYPNLVTGVITMGISVFLRRELVIKFFLPFFHFFLKKYRKRYIKKEYLREYEAGGSYAFVPTKSIYDFFAFVKNFTKRELSKVKVPSLIIHSKDDAIAHPLSSYFVYNRIGSKRKELLMLEEVNHNPLESRRKDIIFGKIDEFIGKLG